MGASQPQIYCPNLNCSAPLNEFGSLVCANCQTPLVYRYLWAVGEAVLTAPVHSTVAGRYYVKAPQIWLDTQPALKPDFPPADLPDEIQSYLYLTPQRSHVPEVYGICELPPPEADTVTAVVLLENAPLNDQGNLLPAIAQSWPSAAPVRQVYWLWQLFHLWEPLAAQGATASLLVADNIRVEGWRVRLCQLFWDDGIMAEPEAADAKPGLSLADLAILWLGWVDQAQAAIADPLRQLCYEMRADSVDRAAIAGSLNHLLLQQAAPLPLRLSIASRTDTGPQYQHNEDACFPATHDVSTPTNSLPSRLAIVCDGIGGHEGGEVASQMAVRSLPLQVQALLAEIAEQTELLSPAIVAEQLTASVRVINDLIAAQNDAQGREARRRMGTTLVMGLQLPQLIRLPETGEVANSHELYVVNVGDSRAYWITPRYCHCLTLDDDVATREARMGRMIYREALQRPDAGSLIQALGTRDSEFLHPTIQRFVVEEDGVLMLCSDGLSDNGWVETSWQAIMGDVFRGKRSLDAAATAWIDLANQKNGHDNATVVLLNCHVSSPMPEVLMPPTTSDATSDWSEASRALLQDEPPVSPPPPPPASKQVAPKVLWIALIVALLAIAGGVIWQQLNSGGNLLKQEQRLPGQ